MGQTVPRYAILSHTWGPDHDEVTFTDLGKDIDTYTSKPDTCCIDKSSSAELTEAINSMFAWYRDAARCYVYLSDVSAGTPISGSSDQQEWYPAFQQSRWMARGWTLQELLTPASVKFFSVEGHRLGNRYSLLQELHSIIGISIKALQGGSLDRFSVEERLSWVGRRQTKHEEDMAYSLLGIFDVHMPLIYGEGRKKSFARLRREINLSANGGPLDIPQSNIPKDQNQASMMYNTPVFNGLISGHYVVPGTHVTGGTVNFNFGKERDVCR
ncbi:hypothetical protein COCSADRAFT_164842 [Bipolaris sorokiniana ND90Pr]|uniref:Heterokaryon incompatibility domain-containing protein n=1 Tax=Cochliobolus sativus (strain ND90Pr / ATCC 201652) TaxID=665912 RepID=M2SR65_COCSN|nr:uncharacterized protein COCSADRAFT_164842 [Bipolaris sorokiniana ND90Pr]EMD59272.1 hypothetical protein COCSADRAFT_164842 [Bipolaris sorokiniana ND90Pr]